MTVVSLGMGLARVCTASSTATQSVCPSWALAVLCSLPERLTRCSDSCCVPKAAQGIDRDRGMIS